MTVTPVLFEAFLRCPTKCYLLAHNTEPSGNVYATWLERRQEEHRLMGTERLKQRFDPAEIVNGQVEWPHLDQANWRLALDVALKNQTMETNLHAVEKIPAGAGKSMELLPIRFSLRNRPARSDELLLAFDAALLAERVRRPIGAGRLICGEAYEPHRVKLSGLLTDTQKVTTNIAALIGSPSAPELALNKHCAECQFQASCRQKAQALDDLSLFTGMRAEERQRHRCKGIFTVHQLSYTFRPRRRPKKATPQTQPHSFALQALALRENMVYVQGTPELPKSDTRIFLDIEGLSSSGPFYLLGALVATQEREEFHPFWADSPSDELRIFSQFIDLISGLPNYRIFHYGSYDTRALKIVRPRLPETMQTKVDSLLKNASNVLSAVHSHVYFPTYSNGLKEVGRFLDCQRTTEHLAGLQSIVARREWEKNRTPQVKLELIRYNQEDCLALKRLCDFITELSEKLPDSASPSMIRRSEDLPHNAIEYKATFGQKQYALTDLKYVSKCAYFDYQREKVVFRTHPRLRCRSKAEKHVNIEKLHPNNRITLQLERCPKCGTKRLERVKLGSPFFVLDLKFTRTGVRRFTTEFRAWNHWCPKCRYPYSARRGAGGSRLTFGRSLLVWFVYCNVFCCQGLNQITKTAFDLFQISLRNTRVRRAKYVLAQEFRPLYDEILGNLLAGPLRGPRNETTSPARHLSPRSCSGVAGAE